MTKHGLGKGVEALFSTALMPDAASAGENVVHLQLDDIRPNKFQPRRSFDEAQLRELAASIQQHGVLQPIVVRPSGDGYELAAGERRWRAARLAGEETIPAVVRDYDDAAMTEIALIENLQRQDLNAIEEALAYQRLMTEFSLTQEEVARRIGRSRSQIANTLRLLHLPPTVQEFVARGTLSMGHAKPLLALPDAAQQSKAAEYVISHALSVRDTEAYVRRLTSERTVKKPPRLTPDVHQVALEDTLRGILGTQVHIKAGPTKGRIEIEYYGAEDLERIVAILSAPASKATPPAGALVV